MPRNPLEALASPCRLCPRECRAERAAGNTGYCGMPIGPVVAQAGLHFGEEDCLVAGTGSGTVFLSGCNLLCLFCQNWAISHRGKGVPVSVEELSRMFLALQAQGAANINLVTPSHFAHAVFEAVSLSRDSGLSVPVVYNCGGFEKVETLRALENLVDIYMPDVKTLDPDFSSAAMNAPAYPETVIRAVREMHRQVGDLEIRDGRAVKGLLVRHLVMPGRLDDSKKCLDFLASLSPRAAVNVMGQYRPVFRAPEIPAIAGRPSLREVEEARSYAASLGLRLL